jgi:hypothetical protein
MKFSIVTPSFNQFEWLRLCIARVADQAKAQLELEHIVQSPGPLGIDVLAAQLNASSSNIFTCPPSRLPTFPDPNPSTTLASSHLPGAPSSSIPHQKSKITSSPNFAPPHRRV